MKRNVYEYETQKSKQERSEKAGKQKRQHSLIVKYEVVLSGDVRVKSFPLTPPLQ